ncbi:MAG: septum site-determining protein MinC [Nitrospirae bacterium]|uniref:septum site-determining protein MinC n=1 Tax=Candidatus Magnetobacterium casense TaxID=1455061 RepID=UPI00058E8D08|nr:septum site-determining protein MinC [Candidatus Magnetobacterium casensis]MBF0337897.1 septum site-determining protein MinC [Nitrospirota bacterium]
MAIEIKGITIPALLINLDSLISIEDNLKDIELKMSSSFFSNSKVVINTNGLDLADGDRGRLHEMLREHGALIVDFKTNFSFESREKKKVIESSEEKRTLMTVSKTIRGGQRVTYDGDLMIIGNVNPGAYVIATGNIIVLGVLKGVAHAGAAGDEEAVVIALTLKPQQLKIANIVTRPPDDDVQTLYPEKAFVKDKTIQIEKI